MPPPVSTKSVAVILTDGSLTSSTRKIWSIVAEPPTQITQGLRCSVETVTPAASSVNNGPRALPPTHQLHQDHSRQQRDADRVEPRARIDQKQTCRDQRAALYQRSLAEQPTFSRRRQGDERNHHQCSDPRDIPPRAPLRQCEQQTDTHRVQHENERHNERRQRVLPRLQCGLVRIAARDCCSSKRR